MWEDCSSWECEKEAKQGDPPVSAEQRQQTTRTPRHLNNTLAADVSCRCPVKIKDSATNAINKQWVGVWRNGLRGNSKECYCDWTQIGGGPVPAEFLIIIWSKVNHGAKKRGLLQLAFILHSVMVYKLHHPPQNYCCSCYVYFLYNFFSMWKNALRAA